jgi:hypothetical protein
VLDVALGGLDQVGNQVVAALQLHVDLREGVLEAIAHRHQAVVDRDRPEHDHNDDDEENDSDHVRPPAVFVAPL